MYWIIIYFLVAIVLVVYMTYTERAEKESHDWHTEDHLVDLVSVSKHWYEEYGAAPAVICEGIIEFAVPQPVSEEESLPLAEEHYAFCTDIVDQSLGTINALADVLRKSTVWFFCWV